MTADTLEELHRMARRLGLKRSWFQGDHYDLVPTKRQRAISLGAVEVGNEELAAIAHYDLRGLPRPPRLPERPERIEQRELL